ncbi:MAG: phenylalanine--tRNA ligase subunit beta [Actinomycetota bacterium]
MKIVLSWLREFCPIDLSPDALGGLLAGKGMHVESVLRPWEGLEGVVVARVLEVRDHPSSDRLCLARIDIGSTEREVVVGVRNMGPGDLVPYAGPGARVPALPEPLESRKIRGVLSEGMICSARELGLSADHSGILVLAPHDPPSAPGADFKAAFGLDDVVLDLEIETNRPDELSVVGVAREVSAATGVPFTPPDTSVAEGGGSASEAASVEIRDLERCPRYLARVIRGVRIGASPIPVQARLTAAGMRPLSNVVDATNYVMLEMGQPMHPFDLDLLEGRGIVVRRATNGERLVTLDEVERELGSDDLVIADRTKSVAIAGVMGSATAEVSETTTDVLLESAYFEPRGIMRTSRRLMLPTEASMRFSRGADPEAVAPAADRAARLMIGWSGGGTVLAGAIDVGGAPERKRLAIRSERASLVIGHEVSTDEIVDVFGRLGVGVEKAEGSVVVEVPSYRPDLEREEDLIEEVVRVQGYESVRATLPGIKQAGDAGPSYALRRRVRETLVRAGLREALSLSFASASDLELMGHAGGVRLANPPSAGEPFLRTSLIPNLLRALTGTLYRGARGAALFEVGHVFRASDPIEEREVVAAAITGPARQGLYGGPRVLDFFDARGALEALMEALSVGDWHLGDTLGRPFHAGRSSEVVVSGDVVGVIGELHPALAKPLDLPDRVAVFELDVEAAALHAGPGVRYRDVPRFPPVRRDLAFTLDAGIPAAAVRAALEEAVGDLLDSCTLFDVHAGAPLPEGKKSLAFAIDFRAPDRTLTDEDASVAVARAVERLAGEFGAELRSG